MRGAVLHARVAEPARGGAVCLRHVVVARADDVLELGARREGAAERLLTELLHDLVGRVRYAGTSRVVS